MAQATEGIAELLLVETRMDEAALLYIAVSLRRPGTRIAELRSLAGVQRYLNEHRQRAHTDGEALPGLVIADERALAELAALPAAPAWMQSVPLVGFTSLASERLDSRARALGVRGIYPRPMEWAAYCQAAQAILAAWLPRRTP